MTTNTLKLDYFQILSSANSIEAAIKNKLIRQLTSSESVSLLNNGNVFNNNDPTLCIYLTYDTVELKPHNIRNCTFHGVTLICGGFSDMISIGEGLHLPSGLYNSNILNICIFHMDCRISDVTFLSNMILREKAVIHNCEYVLFDSTDDLSNRIVKVNVGPENTGRYIYLNLQNGSINKIEDTMYKEILSYSDTCREILLFDKKKNDKNIIQLTGLKVLLL